MHGKVMEFEKKPLNNHDKIMEFCEIIWRNHQSPTASFLATDGFKCYWWFQVFIISKCMHGLQACCCCCIPHLCSALWKGDAGGCAFNSHGNYIVDQGKSWKTNGIVLLNFCRNPALIIGLCFKDEITCQNFPRAITLWNFNFDCKLT